MIALIRREGRTFYVPSRTRYGVEHRIDWALDGALYCNCEASAFNLSCWAVKAVREELEMTNATAVTIAPIQLQRPVSLIPSDSELARMEKVAGIILAGGVDLPDALDTPQKVMAVMLKGRALGLDPTIAIDHIHIIDGHAVPDAQILAGILARDVPNSQLLIQHEDPEQSCTMRLIMPSRGIDATYTVTMQDSDVSMLVQRDTPHQVQGRNGAYTTKPGGWVMYPRDRLRWHATKRLLRIYAPDVINGLSSYGMGEQEEPEMMVIEGAVVNRTTGEITPTHGEPQTVASEAGPPTPPTSASSGPSQPSPSATPPKEMPRLLQGYRALIIDAIRELGPSEDDIEATAQTLFGNQSARALGATDVQALAAHYGLTVSLPGQPYSIVRST